MIAPDGQIVANPCKDQTPTVVPRPGVGLARPTAPGTLPAPLARSGVGVEGRCKIRTVISQPLLRNAAMQMQAEERLGLVLHGELGKLENWCQRIGEN
jgi:hypothetical protein